jgi:hypothetical protein
MEEHHPMIGSAGEIVLSRRARPQQYPEINRGGDCGACALGGALNIDVSSLYEQFTSKGITNAYEMARCLRCASSYGLADRIIETPCEWPSNRYLRSFGSPAVHEYLCWFNYVRMAIDAGYYGLAQIDFSGNGGPETNHWVLICGSRTKGAVTNEVITGDVLISCSVTGEKWYEARDFLTRMGGYDVRFVRPAELKAKN